MLQVYWMKYINLKLLFVKLIKDYKMTKILNM